MQASTTKQILRIDSSTQRNGSLSRALGDEVERRVRERHPAVQVEYLDLADGMTHIDADWIAANFTPAEQRDDDQRARLAASEAAVASLRRADTVIVTAPVYNFSIPSPLKAWVDHVCRAGQTFRYTENGPLGLLQDRPVYLAMASGGVPFGSDVDFASRYLRQVFRFIGIDDVRLIGAEGVARDAESAQREALEQLQVWLPDLSGQAA